MAGAGQGAPRKPDRGAFGHPRAHCLHASIFRPFFRPIRAAGELGGASASQGAMRLFITAVIAAIVGGCAGTGFTDLSTLQKGPNGKTWTQETFESKGSE